MTNTENQIKWEERWGDDDYSSFWMTAEPPSELKMAVSTGGFPAHGRILDIGCGQGELSAWLAQQGYTVLGIDFSSNAIRRAEQTFGSTAELEFKSLDMCGDISSIGKFDGLFDRGCLHGMTMEQRESYVKNVSGLLPAGSNFLLLHRTPLFNNEPEAERLSVISNYLHGLFSPCFDIKDIRATVIAGHLAKHETSQLPAVVLWMTRR